MVNEFVTDVVDVSDEYRVSGCSCRSRFCPACATARGYALRRRVLAHGKIRSFGHLQMWTLTIDPDLFDSPHEAYEYCRDKRVISVLVRKLRRRGVLLSPHYFCAVEWQKDTEMVHFHLLVNSKFIPFGTVCEIWNAFRPAAAGPVTGDRPGFGSVRFSVKRFCDASHAINYATKYVVKTPEHGWPEWVLESRRNIPRYQTSRDFFDDGKPQSTCWDENEPLLTIDPETGEAVTVDSTDEESGEDVEEERATIRERVAACRSKAVVVRVRETLLSDGEVIRQTDFLGVCGAPFAELCRAEGFTDDTRPFWFPITADRISDFVSIEGLSDEQGTDQARAAASECNRSRSREDAEGGPGEYGAPDSRGTDGASVPETR
ncbi:MAG: hypothetical protein AAFU85_24415 [Planctomycetota bacterium]